MKSSTSTILAVGAAGKFAGLVVPALAERGAKVRGLVRDAREGEAVRKRGATEIAKDDLRDGASLDAALKDVDAVFYIAPAFLPDEAETCSTGTTGAALWGAFLPCAPSSVASREPYAPSSKS